MMARIGYLINRLVLPLLVSQAIESATPLLPTYPLVGSQPTDLSPSCSDPPAVALTMEGHDGVGKSSGGVGSSGGGGSKGRASEGTGPAGDLREALLGGEGGAKGRSWSKDGGGGDKTLAAATSGSSSGGARSPPGSGGGAAAGGARSPQGSSGGAVMGRDRSPPDSSGGAAGPPSEGALGRQPHHQSSAVAGFPSGKTPSCLITVGTASNLLRSNRTV